MERLLWPDDYCQVATRLADPSDLDLAAAVFADRKSGGYATALPDRPTGWTLALWWDTPEVHKDQWVLAPTDVLHRPTVLPGSR